MWVFDQVTIWSTAIGIAFFSFGYSQEARKQEGEHLEREQVTFPAPLREVIALSSKEKATSGSETWDSVGSTCPKKKTPQMNQVYFSTQKRLDDCEKRLATLEKTGVSSIGSLRSARGCPTSSGIYLKADFLWMQLVQDNLEYAGRSLAAIGSDLPIFELLTAGFAYNRCGRVVVGGNLPSDGWDVSLMWTYLHAHTFRSKEGSITALINQSGQSGPFVFQTGSADWMVQLHQWGLLFGRWSSIGKKLAMRPIFGVRGIVLREHLATLYQGGESVSLTALSMREKTRFWGVGPEIGIDGKWFFANGFALYGKFRSAAFYGQFKAINDVQATGSALTSERVQGHNLYRVRPMIDGGIGFEWGSCWHHWFFFALHVGWEVQYFWSQNAFVYPNGTKRNGDLSANGINCGIQLDF